MALIARSRWAAGRWLAEKMYLATMTSRTSLASLLLTKVVDEYLVYRA